MSDDIATKISSVCRRSFLRLCAAGSGLGLTGCGFLQGLFPQSTPTPGSLFVEQPTAALQGPTVTTVAAGKTTILLNAPNIGIRPVLENFERDNPDFTVQYITKSDSEAYQELHNALKYGDNVPDMAIIFSGGVGGLLSFDGLHDLGAAPFDAGKLEGAIVPGLWEAGKINGKRIVIPWAVAPGMMTYRLDMLKEAGIDGELATLEGRIKTWDDLLLLAQEYTQKQPERAFFMDARDVFYGMLAQQGYNLLDGRKVLIEEIATIPAKTAARVRSDKLDAKLGQNVNMRLAVQDKEFVGMISSLGALSYIAGQSSQTNGIWRVLRLPGGPAFSGALFLGIPAKAQNPQAGWRLLRYLVTEVQSQTDWLANLGLVPCYMPSWETPLIDQGVEFLGGQQIYKLAIEQARAMPKIRFSAYDSDANEIIDQQITQVLDMGKDPEKAMRDAEMQVIAKGTDLVG